VLARFHLSYDHRADKGVPSSLIAKFPTTPRRSPSTSSAISQRSSAAIQQHYERGAREVLFYQHLASLHPVPAPRLYYGAADEATGRIILLVQDLSTARPGDVLHGCSPEEAEQILQAIAPFHAHWWAHPRVKDFAWLPQWVGDPQVRQEGYNRQVGPFLQRFGQQLPPFIHEAIGRLRADYAQVLTRLAEAPATLIHADLHLDNILFSPSGHNHPVTVLDWQSISCGAAAVDVALFLYGSLSIEQRRAKGHALLARYHTRLAEDGVSGYSFQQLLDDCRLALLWNLAGTVGWLGSVDFDQLVGRERALVEAALGDGKLIAALQDTDALAALSPK
jgi:aminoglycoside/choline kinase family phosphotransferase